LGIILYAESPHIKVNAVKWFIISCTEISSLIK